MRSVLAGAGSDFELPIDYLPAYGYAACLAQIHPVYALGPPAGEQVSGLLEVAVAEIDYRSSVSLRRPAPASCSPLSPAVANRLEALPRRTSAHLCLSLDGAEVARLPVTILPPSEWPHLREFRKLVAAHVLPGDDAVFRTVVDSAAVLRAQTQLASLPEAARAESPDAVATVLRALYTYLAEECRINYEDPQIQADPWSDVTYQTVRAPHRVIGSPSHRTGKGNCLDLSLLGAGCLEALGLQPLILFTADLDESPSHAFLGCWTQRGRRFRPLLTDGRALREGVEAGQLAIVEATGVCTGSHHLSFEEATRAGVRHLDEASSIHALDVCATRPPQGEVRPVRLANAAVVQHAHWKAEELRETVQAEARETLHVLYGLCAAEGEITAQLLQDCGSSARRVRKIIETSLPRENHTGPGRETNNYRLCLEASRLNARNREATIVEEPDVLWAVLDSTSRNIAKVLAAAGCDPSQLLAQLGRQWERPRAATISRYFRPVPTTGEPARPEE